MNETITSLIWAGVILGTTGFLSLAGLKAWRDWLDLKRYEIGANHDLPQPSEASSGVRIELADLRERLRKLEAIATGVDP